ncbi:MAG: ATP-binding protein [Coxiellaceae bacterium]|nr:ATP-binding protein [Coxiellaceae bacterium]
MSVNLTCREEELSVLEQLLQSEKAELLALYGRRRVGKTFLVRAFFSETENTVFFNSTGMKDAPMTDQITNFTEEIGETFLYKGARLETGKNWRETFRILTDNISAVSKNKKIVLFFDEFPWMATKNSRLLQSLEYFWNQHWSKDKRVKLIICGSSASWIIKKIVHNTGGLHNRLTREISLEPLNLCNTKRFIEMMGAKLSNRQVLEFYLVTGGIPYYLSYFDKNLSVTQNIEELCFKRKGLLIEEFDKLYASLFSDHELYIKLIRTIAAHKYGIGQSDLFHKVQASLKGKSGLDKLDALIHSSFIISLKPMGHSKKGIYYKVIDEYTLFYLSWIEPIRESLMLKSIKRGYWEKQQNTASWFSWSGYAFEAICYKHIAQISESLKLGPTAIPYAWRHAPRTDNSKSKGAQIDLLFDRADDAITLCEIKCTTKPFIIDREYAEKLQSKVDVFRKVTGTKKQIFIAMISANGVKNNKYSKELLSATVTLEDLFLT